MDAERSVTRRSLFGWGFAALIAMEEPEFHGVSALLDGDGLARIPAGEFDMGSAGEYADEKPVHRVRITQPFEIGKYEITQMQWQTVMSEAHPRQGAKLVNAAGGEVSSDPSQYKGATLPVENISWNDVQLFLARLSARSPTHRFRLPTEAEWEYAARGLKGDGPPALGKTAWFGDNSDGATHPIGTKLQNSFGLFDMDGNVSEWVNDYYAFDYYESGPRVDPQGPAEGSYRVFRGGCWSDDERACRVSARRFDFPVNRFHNVGFRVVRELK